VAVSHLCGCQTRGWPVDYCSSQSKTEREKETEGARLREEREKERERERERERDPLTDQEQGKDSVCRGKRECERDR